MGSRTPHKKRHHRGQENASHQYAAKRQKQGHSMSKGNDPPGTQRGRETADKRERAQVEQHTDDYVRRWLVQVTEESHGHRHTPASGLHSDPPLHIPPGYGHGRQSSEQFHQAIVKDAKSHPRRKHGSSDSSMLLPAYEQAEPPRQKKATVVVQDTRKEQTSYLPNKHSKNRQQKGIFSSSSDESQSESDQSQPRETFEKRNRHKTRADRYESKKAARQAAEGSKAVKKKTVKVKRGDAARVARKAGEDLIRDFRSKNVSQDRLTMRPGAGIFKNGRASSPSRPRGLPDLAFSEMQFLKQSNRTLVDREGEVIISKSGQKSTRERERARNEISNYFIPGRQPLLETTTNHGRKRNSELRSDASKSEATTIARRYYPRPRESPQNLHNKQNELYLGFGTAISTPQKFALPKLKLDPIFTPRIASYNNALSKSASYCTWSETARSPSARGMTRITDAPRNQWQSASPASLQRKVIRPVIYKEIGIQAIPCPEMDSSPKTEMRTLGSEEGNIQHIVGQALEPARNLSTAKNICNQISTEDQDENAIYQLQANRAVFHDCEPHKRSEQIIQEARQASHTAAEKFAENDTDTTNQCKDDSVAAYQKHPDLEVQSVLSRAALAQRAYINRRSIPKVTVDLTANASDERALAADVPNARDTTTKVPNENYDTSTAPQGEHRNAQASASQTLQLLPRLVDDGQNEDASLLGGGKALQTAPEPVSSFIRHSQSKGNNDVGYKPNGSNHNTGGDISRVNDPSRHPNNIMSGPEQVDHKTDTSQIMLPARGFSAGMAPMLLVSRNASPLPAMEPIYARQLHSQAYIAQEESQELYNTEQQEQGTIYLYEGGQWEKESRSGFHGAQQQNSLVELDEVHMGQNDYGDMYGQHHDEYSYTDDAIYYGEKTHFPDNGERQDAAESLPEGMLFFNQVCGPNSEYQWMPRARTNFSGATTDQVQPLGSWEMAQMDLIPRETLLEFWQPRKGY